MIYVISGIDTGIGKTRATAELGTFLQNQNRSFITAKLVQTGSSGIAEDIREHRRLLGQDLFPEDHAGTTCPYVFSFAGSPHLAARLEGKTIDPDTIVHHMQTLEKQYGTVLCEGAGGLMVPLQPGFTLLDLVSRQKWPVILVSSSRLGSLNHTLLSLSALRTSACRLVGIVYNRYEENDATIGQETADYLRNVVGVSALVEIGLQPDNSNSIFLPDFSLLDW